ncbi:DUF2971 domain-containing protein [Streptococcus anginosus]|uniref:DUF2971 domain-containing protein n=1 Tax=Streptococcus anginosus TaxID=1328 RepID=UPI000E4509ED|nr:DUF2971 domain-containing protein [Streptococcus anginosus]RGN68746.1 DUF2971 domain-containing protein [Streptococcus anginosus]
MFYINWDDNLYHNNSEKSCKAPNTFVFYPDNWNDYGYYLTYTVCYYDQNLNEILLGNYRIYNPIIESQDYEFGKKWIKFQIDSEGDFSYNDNETFYNYNDNGYIENINENYYSLAHDISFYQNLYTLGSDYYKGFLTVFRDLTVIDLPEKIKENEGVKKALLRNDEVTNSKDILDLNEKIREIDESLNVGNYLSTDNHFNKIYNYILDILQGDQLNDKKESISIIVKGSGYNFTLLSNLVKAYMDKPFEKIFYEGYDFLKSLLDKTTFEQLKSDLKSIDDENLNEILQNVNTIKNKLKYKLDTIKENKNFIHYTSLNTLNFLLPNKKNEDKSYPRLRLSNARQMNDPNEGYTLLELIGIKKEELPVTDYETSPFYFASMSQTGGDQNLEDSLPMWKQYGDDAKGINLTYHSNYIQDLVNEDIEIYRVCYNVSKEEDVKKAIDNIKDEFNEIRNRDDAEKQQTFFSALRLIDSIRYLFKEEDYSYENEYRIIKSYEGKEHEIFPFKNANSAIPGLYVYLDKELKCSKIKLGPKCEDIDFIAPYIKYVDPEIEVTQSKIPYR